MLAVIGGSMLFGLLQGGGRRRLGQSPRLLTTGMALWTLAAFLGLSVALVSGNGLTRVAGQFLSLLLLPLGWAAARLTTASPGRFPRLAKALVVVAFGASLLHFAAWGIGALQGLPPQRLYFGNSVSITGVLPLILVLLMALRPRLPGRALLVTAFVIYLAGSGSRGAWLAAALGALALALLRRRGNPKPAASNGWKFTLAALSVIWIALLVWLESPRQNVLPSRLPAELLPRILGPWSSPAPPPAAWPSKTASARESSFRGSTSGRIGPTA